MDASFFQNKKPLSARDGDKGFIQRSMMKGIEAGTQDQWANEERLSEMLSTMIYTYTVNSFLPYGK